MARERVKIDALLERLAGARREGDAIASDGDETLWRGDIGDALFVHALERGHLRRQASEALAEEARRQGVEPHADPNETARRLLRAQREGRYPDREAYAMMAWCFAGFELEELSSYAEAVLDHIDFGAAVRSFTPKLLAFARRHEHPFWLVSASPIAVVRAAARRIGVDAERCVAMEPEEAEGVVLPRLVSEPTHADGKVRRLREQTPAALLAGLGDSIYDAALIAEARIGVAVLPRPDLEAVLTPASLVLEE